jgi:predicted porin
LVGVGASGDKCGRRTSREPVALKFEAKVDLAAAYYGYRQNSYGTGANAGCTSNNSTSCSGALNGLSLSADWRFTKRFDAYGGALWTSVRDGLSSGYLNTSNIATTVGIRYS